MHTTHATRLRVVVAALLVLLLLACVAPAHGSGGSNSSSAASRTRPPLSPVYTLESVQLVHRHGARAPLVYRDDAAAVCATSAYPCGELNDVGQTMMRNVGAYLRARYGTNSSSSRSNNSSDGSNSDKDTTTFDTTGFLPSTRYNVSVVYARSSDVRRTLQSAAALLGGLFPDNEAFFPAIHTVERATDTLLSVAALPALWARARHGDDRTVAACGALVDERGLDAHALRDVADELRLSPTSVCRAVDGDDVGGAAPSAAATAAAATPRHRQDVLRRIRCAEMLCDVALSYAATGRRDAYARLSARADDVCAVAACAVRDVLAYNARDATHAQQGSFAQDLLEQLLANMQNKTATLAKKQKQKDDDDDDDDDLTATRPADGLATTRLHEYSTHDSRLVTLGTTLEANNADAAQPPPRDALLVPFATTYVFELWRRNGDDGDDGGAAGWLVRVLRGWPGQEPATNYTFALSPLTTLRCVDAAGRAYVADAASSRRLNVSGGGVGGGGVCPLDDFARAVRATRPRSAAGLCYLDEELLSRLRCPRDGGGDAAATRPRKLPKDCARYRKACPRFACGGGGDAVLSAVDLTCHRRCHDNAAAAATTNATTTTTTAPPRSDAALVAPSAGALLLLLLLAAAAVAVLLCLRALRRRRALPCNKGLWRSKPHRTRAV